MDSKNNHMPRTTGWLRRSVAILLLVAGGVSGMGQKLADRIPSLFTARSLPKNETLKANQRIDTALKGLLGVPEASADVPDFASCSGCGSCGCGCCGCDGCDGGCCGCDEGGGEEE